MSAPNDGAVEDASGHGTVPQERILLDDGEGLASGNAIKVRRDQYGERSIAGILGLREGDTILNAREVKAALSTSGVESAIVQVRSGFTHSTYLVPLKHPAPVFSALKTIFRVQEIEGKARLEIYRSDFLPQGNVDVGVNDPVAYLKRLRDNLAQRNSQFGILSFRIHDEKENALWHVLPHVGMSLKEEDRHMKIFHVVPEGLAEQRGVRPGQSLYFSASVQSRRGLGAYDVRPGRNTHLLSSTALKRLTSGGDDSSLASFSIRELQGK